MNDFVWRMNQQGSPHPEFSLQYGAPCSYMLGLQPEINTDILNMYKEFKKKKNFEDSDKITEIQK